MRVCRLPASVGCAHPPGHTSTHISRSLLLLLSRIPPAGALLLTTQPPVLLLLPQTLRVPSAVSDQEGVQVEVTRLLVASYFDIVRKNLQAS